MFTLTLALALAAATAPAESRAANDPTGSTQTARPAKPTKICKTTKMTGSSIGRRVCKTADEWNDMAADGMQSLDVVDQSFKATAGNGAVD